MSCIQISARSEIWLEFSSPPTPKSIESVKAPWQKDINFSCRCDCKQLKCLLSESTLLYYIKKDSFLILCNLSEVSYTIADFTNLKCNKWHCLRNTVQDGCVSARSAYNTMSSAHKLRTWPQGYRSLERMLAMKEAASVHWKRSTTTEFCSGRSECSRDEGRRGFVEELTAYTHLYSNVPY